MSTRQKSFFDQDPKAKFKGQWRPRNAPPFPHPSNNHAAPPPRRVVTGPPIMPSTQTRTKLKAFQFIEGAPTVETTKEREAEKENSAVAVGRASAKDGMSRALQTGKDNGKATTTPKPATSKSCPPPSTPAMKRLPLADLVGNIDDSSRHAPQPVVSPEEQLIWRGSQPMNTPLPRKNKKRARSSSPVGPSQDDHVYDAVKKDLTTPQADPAMELWSRYTSNKGTPSANKSVAFAHLINESSPRSAVAAGSVSGLRRWASCGHEFPASNRKRRRTHGVFQGETDRTEDVFSAAPSSDGVMVGQPPKSNIASMDTEISETMQGQDAVAEEDAQMEEADPARSFGSSDDFGDDDFDDMVDALDISPQTSVEQLVQPVQHISHVTTPTEPVRPPAQEQPHVAVQAINADSDDEFGMDEDEDGFAADLEQVASLYDTRPIVSPSQKTASGVADTKSHTATRMSAPTTPIIDLVEDDDDDDDEFGDEIDADVFAAAEVAATQPSANNVLLVEEEKTKLFKAITLRQAWFDTPCTPSSFVHIIGEFSSTGQCIVDDHNNMIILHPDHLISATVVADSFGCLRRAVLQDRVKATSKANAPMLYGTLLHELFQEALKVNRWDSDFLLETIDKLLPTKFETILEIVSTCEAVKEHLSSKLPELQAWAEIFVRAEPRADAIVRERNGRQSTMSINKLLDVEEHVWSPITYFPLIDAVLTGVDVDIAYGVLYYLETSDISRIPAIRNDIIHMIIKRNELACYVRDRIELPPILKEDFKCQKCYAQEPCFLYDNLVEGGKGEQLNKKAKERYDELVKPLKPSHQEFMKKWDTLLTKEETDMMKFRRELWTMLSTEREKLGRCFSNVILEPGSGYEEKAGQKINRYSYTFVKQQAKPGFSFTESQLIIGEPVVVSDEQGHFALANGYVTNVRKRRITVAVDRRLHNSRTKLPGFHSQTNQTFTGIMEVGKEGEPVPEYEANEEPVLYRLDKDEFSNGMAAARNNLIQIMDDSVFKVSMNSDQKAAITKVMSAKDCALVLGMPGTGKTTTIAHIIRTLVAKGKSVLLTSYTHTAVDNILLKIKSDKIGILRLGASAKIHPDVREFATLAAEPKDSLEALEKSWMEPPVVATTCLTINHPLFNRRIFDYCIVDEASQITLPVCLGPIRMSRKFILVGDHYQLPPLVQNKEAMEGGLDVSLFKMLCEAHPQAVVSLEHQYRMCADIMLLSNTFIYSGRLKCVFINTDLISQSLEDQSGSRITNTLEARLVTQLTVSLLSLGVSANEVGIIAFYRSQLALLRTSLSSAHTQTQASELAAPAVGPGCAGVELHTADKFQGRDKEVVIVSCVRSNENSIVGDLLKDRRRVNVALTRARSKLIILGSEKTLSNNELLRDMIALCREKDWVHDLQPDAVDSHTFDEGVTQTGKTPTRPMNMSNKSMSPHESPSKRRKVMGEVTANARSPKKRIGSSAKVPGKVITAGKRGVLDGRPLLRDIYNGAM
ncbi:hypothetical protein SNOG_07199 [Parastagonospora nodorum SN15]|uniref:DNA replication ATP-dependent helicase/nuclease n=1 Tax=Phaeosphaeria nodorum (strain SN15 / ATCC MYA-4574 / FGSC 10173) TaxID=321614 RepID=Q0UM15_PHANO|nr:hypothetical protein SNOG_07199 [Parastagonospora nodorum SN15]EAT85850.2 hypothetical protein SNOG_07199 [Parastagonospora nodorum SN15]